MYHERTYRQQRELRRRRLVYGVVAAVLVLVVACMAGVSRSIAREQAASTVREAVVAGAQQCCAIEGSYPPSLAYLEREYGLVVNHDAYVVSYEWLGDNVPPSVVVRPR